MMAPMRLLVTSAPGVGHLLPLLPIAQVARARRHEVLVGCGSSLGAIPERAGLRQVDIGPSNLDAVRARLDHFGELVGRERAQRMYREGFASVAAEETLDDVLELAGAWRPDLIVHDDMEMGSWMAAEMLGIPHVSVQAAAWRPHQRPWLVEPQNAIRIRHGLEPDPELAGRDGALWFTTRPPSMRDAAAAPPPRLRELRPEPDDRTASPSATPAWLRDPGSRPRIAVTLGTVNAHRVDLFRPIVAGVAELDVEVVVGLGADPATLGPVPPNVRVEAFVAMSELLPSSAAVVHHAGAGTTLSALAAARPMVLVPITADQFENAEGALRTGAALELDATALTATAARIAVARLLGDPTYAERAAATALEIAAMPDAEAAWAEIEGLA
jgi:UDP:flavonoid glycosyltransferase YjiC (YdhE family)